VKFLIKKGAEPNARDKNGITAMMWAKWGGHSAVVEILKEAGARE
jgi:ankyrin repeat protein